MAKKPTLLQLAKGTTPNRAGQRDWREQLSPADRAEYEEFIAHYRKSPRSQRITFVQARALVKQRFGLIISQHTFKNHVDGE